MNTIKVSFYDNEYSNIKNKNITHPDFLGLGYSLTSVIIMKLIVCFFPELSNFYPFQ